MRDLAWDVIHNPETSRSIPWASKVVLLGLAEHVDGAGVVKTGERVQARWCGMSRAGFRRHRAPLVKLGLIGMLTKPQRGAAADWQLFPKFLGVAVLARDVAKDNPRPHNLKKLKKNLEEFDKLKSMGTAAAPTSDEAAGHSLLTSQKRSEVDATGHSLPTRPGTATALPNRTQPDIEHLWKMRVDRDEADAVAAVLAAFPGAEVVSR